MSDVSGTGGGAAKKEAEMREHEREARERAGEERSPEDPGEDAARHEIDPNSRAADPAGPDTDKDAGREDARPGKPAPPGNINIGGGIGGGS